MFILQEMQTTGTQTALTPTRTYSDRNEAESAFHAALSSAAVSSVPIHAVVLLDEYGGTVRSEFYKHSEG